MSKPSSDNDWAVLHTFRFHLPRSKGGGEVVKVCFQNVITNETKIEYIKNPKRSFWITKPEFRDKRSPRYFNYNKECEKLSNLDEYKCYNYELKPTIRKVLGLPPVWNEWKSDLFKNPHVFGADIPIEVLIKKYYNEKCSGRISKIAFGSLDLETSVLPQTFEQIIIFSFVDHNKNLYISVYRPFIKDAMVDDEVTAHVNKLLDKLKTKEMNIKIFVSYFDTEAEVIKDGLKNLHESKVTICGIWNIDFDIPRLFKRMGALGLNPTDLFNSPDTPKEYRTWEYVGNGTKIIMADDLSVNIRRDQTKKKKKGHIMDKWRLLLTGSRVAFIDSALLYARVRKTSERKASYKLGYTTEQELDMSKLQFPQGLDHFEMQRDNFTDYIAYGGLDPVLVLLLELKNKDVLTLLGDIGNSRLRDYAYPTVTLRDDLHGYYLSNDLIGGCAGGDMSGKFDEHLHSRGGAVLPTDRFNGTGLCVLEEAPEVETLIRRAVGDLDVKAMYPTIADKFNISKGTKVSTCIGIEGCGKDIIVQEQTMEKCFGWMTSPKANAILFCNEFFNLPNTTEMHSVIDQHLNKIQ